jgi:hypothetical protein
MGINCPAAPDRALGAAQRTSASTPTRRPSWQIVHRLVVNAQFLLLERATQLAGDFHAVLGVGGQFLGV